MDQLELDSKQQQIAEAAAQKIAQYRKRIRLFIRDMWGLTPQPCRPEYTARYAELETATHERWEELKQEVGPEWFGTYDDTTGDWRWYSFVKGQHFTWQQNLVLMGVEKAVVGKAVPKISVSSGHGIGKSATCSWITLWYLYVFYECQVACTAPTAPQMHDVLWKEMSLWIGRMHDSDVKELYDWQHDYVRIKYNPEAWFARARTSSKENTEAIAGVHADNVALVVDEASGVPEQVFTTAQGALTSGKVLFIMISNPTRTIGFFFDSHHKNKEDWQTFQFDGEESPMVDKSYVTGIEKQHGRGSEEFGIRVSGVFPGEGVMDDSGYLQLIPRDKITIKLKGDLELPFLGRKILGVDPAGEGRDRATFVLRDKFKATLIHEMLTSNDKEIAEAVLGFIIHFDLDPSDVVVGAFGTGADVGKEVAIASAKDVKGGPFDIYTVMEGNTPEKEEKYNGHRFRRHDDELVNSEQHPDQYEDLYANIRALMYFRVRKWFMLGGYWLDTSVDKSKLGNEVVMIRYKRTLQGNRIQLMSKKEMLKLRIPSPNIADALALTFLRDIDDARDRQTQEERDAIEAEDRMTEEERHNAL